MRLDCGELRSRCITKSSVCCARGCVSVVTRIFDQSGLRLGFNFKLEEVHDLLICEFQLLL